MTQYILLFAKISLNYRLSILKALTLQYKYPLTLLLAKQKYNKERIENIQKQVIRASP